MNEKKVRKEFETNMKRIWRKCEMNWKPVSELKQIYKMFSEANWNELKASKWTEANL